ncbi:hypothetical protein BT63DRAFT_132348 [Microthyrium microscopicum]|uniref:Kinetochore protein NDC80 n=1 Tax=Microthyrium microscopicum TaxID=703497 RepID=A0A6A6ULG2_9PEZI|nr:hypothetical protein BT63DRAFT_132348 [Microthyrium microscopicum]
MSVRRPRETLGGLNANTSAIPMPTSAMKRSTSTSNLHSSSMGAAPTHVRSHSGSRMSMAGPSRPPQPNFARASTAGFGDMAPPMSAQRPSNLMHSARKSLMPMATPARGMGMHTPGPDPLGRRSSVYSGRPSTMSGGMNGGMAQRESFFSTAPVAGVVAVDPRRRDASTRAQMVHELQEYLQRNNFELKTGMGLTGKSMTSPTQKEFATMFKWLYNQVDPSYHFQKNMDAEIPPLLKQLRYPFEKNISKSAIQAVGGQNWHTFLGMLHWLMQLAQMMEAYTTGNFDYACMEAGLDVKSDRIIYQFMTESYSAWLQVDDSAPDDEADKVVKMYVDRMDKDFREVNKDLVADVEMLEADKKGLEEQIADLEQEANYGQRLDELVEVINSDIAKYSTYIDKIESRRKRTEENIKNINDDLNKIEDELAKAEAEKSEYQQTLSSHGITMQDLDRMTTEMERLEQAKAAIVARSDELRMRLTDKELDASRKLDELEQLTTTYNSLAHKIGLIPSTAPNAKGQSFELSLTINPTPDFDLSQSQAPSTRLLKDSSNGYMPYQLLNLDLNGIVRPAITSLRKEISDRQDRALEEHLQNHTLVDGVNEALEYAQGEVNSLHARIRAAEEELDKTQETTTTKKMQSEAHIERIEKELAKLRQGLTETIQSMEQREIATNLEYEQLTIRATSLREELHTQIERILNDVIKFKINIQKKLEAYEEFVLEEVHQEDTRVKRGEDSFADEPKVEQQEATLGAEEDIDMSGME